MKYYCDTFKIAIMNEIINKPGDRMPATNSFSKKHFIIKTQQGLSFYLYVEYCPSCGEKVMEE